MTIEILSACLLVAGLLPPPAGEGETQSEAAGSRLELSLDDAYRIALENNLGLQIEALNTEVVLYNYRASWGSFDWVFDARLGYTDAELQPSNLSVPSSQKVEDLSLDLTKPLAFSGGTFKTHFSATETRLDTNSTSFFSQDVSTTDVLSLQYTQPLLRGAWREFATSRQRENEFESRKADEKLRATRQQLLLDVANAYWDLVAARDALDVAESSLGLARAQVDQNQRRFDAGVGTSIDVLQAQAEAATREEGRLKAEVDVRRAADQLKKLLGPNRSATLWDAELLPTTPPPEASAGLSLPAWNAAFAVAVDRRSDLRQQRFAIEVADVRHRRSQSDRKVGLDLDLSVSSQGFDTQTLDALETTLHFDYPTYRAALAFNYAFGNTNASNLERAAWAAARAARLTYDQLEVQVAAEVREAVRQVAYQAEAVRAADKSLELARRQLAAEELRFANEQSTTFDLLKFQDDLAQAMSRTRRSRADYAKAGVMLDSAQGLLGETRRP